MKNTKKFLQKILKFTCPECATTYQLIETHSLKQGNCGNCPEHWREILQNYHREQCLAYLAETEAEAKEKK